MNFFKCGDCSKSKRKGKKKTDDESGGIEFKSKKRKWTITDANYFTESFIVDTIKFTDEEKFRYIVNSSYFQSVKDYGSGYIMLYLLIESPQNHQQI